MGDPLKPGTRVRLNHTCPWPERVGKAGVTVAHRDRYPTAVPGKVLVLLDADPLAISRRSERWWTCQLGRDSCDPAGGDADA